MSRRIVRGTRRRSIRRNLPGYIVPLYGGRAHLQARGISRACLWAGGTEKVQVEFFLGHAATGLRLLIRYFSEKCVSIQSQSINRNRLQIGQENRWPHHIRNGRAIQCLGFESRLVRYCDNRHHYDNPAFCGLDHVVLSDTDSEGLRRVCIWKNDGLWLEILQRVRAYRWTQPVQLLINASHSEEFRSSPHRGGRMSAISECDFDRDMSAIRRQMSAG